AEDGGQFPVQGKLPFALAHPALGGVTPAGSFYSQFVASGQGVQGVRESALLPQYQAEVAVAFGELGVELEGFFQAGAGLVQLLPVVQGEAEAVVGPGILGVELEGPAEGGNGTVQVLLVIQGKAEVIVGPGIVGFELEDLAKTGDGIVQILLVVQDIA